MATAKEMQEQMRSLLRQVREILAKKRRTAAETNTLNEMFLRLLHLSEGVLVCGDDIGAVTNVQVLPVREPKGKTLAYARVCLGNQLQLTDLRLMDGAHGLFVSYPSAKPKDGEDQSYMQVFYPLTRELRDHIEQVVIEEYQIAIAS